MKMVRSFACFSFLLTAGCLLSLFGQSDLPSAPAIQVTTRLVVLDLAVTDASGKFVPSLDASQFSILEDGVPQKIRTFEPPESHEMPGAAAGKPLVRSSADLGRIGNAPVTILVLDEINTPFMHVSYAMQMLERYLKGQPETLASPTILLSTSAKHFLVIHDYTQDRDALLESLAHHWNEGDLAGINNPSSVRSTTAGGAIQTIGTLAQIADSTRGIPGRKNLIWLGYGYDSMPTEMGNPNEAKIVLNMISNVTERLLRSRVTLYTIDPEGVVAHDVSGIQIVMSAGIAHIDSSGLREGDSNKSNFGPFRKEFEFSRFALSTGGRVVYGRNDIEVQLAKTVDLASQYYTVSYSPTNHSDDSVAYRHIRVVLKDPNLRVSTRDGYFGGAAHVDQVAAQGAARQPASLEYDLIKAATNSLTYTGVHIAGQRSVEGLALRIRANDLHWAFQDDGTRHAGVSTLAVCFDAKGNALGQHAVQSILELKPEDKIDNEHPVGLNFVLNVPPGTAVVRVVLRDGSTGALGTANIKP